MGYFKKEKIVRLKPINYKIGVVIENINDITKLRSNTIDKIIEALEKHSIVIIKGKRQWTENEQKLFTSKLGKLELPAVYSVPHNQIDKRLTDTKLKKGSGIFWHSDNSYQERPSYLSVFQMIEIPASGTKTSFSSLIELYKNLPEKDKLLWQDYDVVYHNNVTHPLLWKHPFNGKQTIYFDIGFSSDIRNHCDNGILLSIKENNKIVNYINDCLSNNRSLIEQHWEKGDIIILDNYAVAHRADILMENEKRTLPRTTTQGVYF